MPSVQLVLLEDRFATMGTCISHSLSDYGSYSCMDGIEILIKPCDKEDCNYANEFTVDKQFEEDDLPSQEAAFEIQMTNDGTYHCSEKTTKVKFGKVEIRQYAVTIGDHPSCSDNLPITLDWAFNPLTNVEAVKDDSSSHIYPSVTPKLSYAERKRRLQDVSRIRVEKPFEIRKTVSLFDSDDLAYINEEVGRGSNVLFDDDEEDNIEHWEDDLQPTISLKQDSLADLDSTIEFPVNEKASYFVSQVPELTLANLIDFEDIRRQ